MAMTLKKLQSLKNELEDLANKFELEQCGSPVSVSLSFHGAPTEVLDAMRKLPGVKERACSMSPDGEHATHEYDEITCDDLSQPVEIGFSAYSRSRPKLTVAGIDLDDACHEFVSEVFGGQESLNDAEIPNQESAEKLATIARTFLSRLEDGS